jgi:hypothetical protein
MGDATANPTSAAQVVFDIRPSQGRARSILYRRTKLLIRDVSSSLGCAVLDRRARAR